MKYITLCTQFGGTMCGTDGHIIVDGRFGLHRIRQEVQEYRNRFKANFRYKYDTWTHFRINKENKLHVI